MSRRRQIDLAKVVVAEAALARVPGRLARRYGILPVALDGDTLTAVQVHPDDPLGAMELESRLGLRIETLAAARPDAVARAIERYYAGAAGDEAPSALAALERLVNRAIQIHCSDIHLDPEENRGVARMRVDGMMRPVGEFTPAFMTDLVSAVKVAAKMDISERRAPQDGQIVMDSLGESIAMRVAVIPTTHGEKVTLRILATAAVSAELDRLDALGMSPRHLAMMRSALDQAHGVVLLSGPTGSGKTTTLYAALRHLKEPGTRHILTIENPVEIPLPGVNQIQIDGERVTVQFGGGCINDTIVHLATSRMGFGGVGHSGMGSYHGKKSFDTFSHEKSVLKKSTRIDMPVRYMPYTPLKDRLLRVFLH